MATGWNSLHIDLLEKYPGIELAKIFQLKWDGMPATCYFDNVYFYKDTEMAIRNTAVVEKAQKTIINGQLIISRNGIRYNALGQVME